MIAAVSSVGYARPTSNYCPYNFSRPPIGVVWLHDWLGPQKLIFFSSGAAFLSLAPSSAKGYYATELKIVKYYLVLDIFSTS